MTLPFLIKYQGDDHAIEPFVKPIRDIKEFVEDMTSNGKSIRTIVAVARATRWQNRTEEVKQLAIKLRSFLKMKN